MASFLLVHGSWHGGWCWSRVAPLLESRGNTVAAPDLPGHGADTRSVLRIGLGAYARRILKVADRLPKPIVLVGHSMGGIAITRAAGDAPPGWFAALIYLCAFAPRPGDSLWSLSREDSDTLLPESIRYRPATVRIRPERAGELFYGDCDAGDRRWATERLRPEPLLPVFQRVRGSAPNGIPRAYIECTRDRTVPVAQQRRMAARAGIERVVSLPASHSPFLSMPDALAAQLLALSDRNA